MEIILMEKVQKLGEIGDVVNVKAGYARNYLLPQGKAMIANAENKLVFNERKTTIETENLKRKKEAEVFSKKLIDGEIRLIRAASESGQLYGSVSSRDISISLKEQNFEINKNQIILNKSLKTLTYEKIQIKLHPEVVIEIDLNVARSEEEANKQKQLKKAITSNEDTNLDNQNNKSEDNVEVELNTKDETSKIETEKKSISEEQIQKPEEKQNDETLDSIKNHIEVEK